MGVFSKHSRHLRRCSTFLVREIQVRTTVRYHLASIRMATKKRPQTQMLTRVWRKGTPCTLPVRMQTDAAMYKKAQRFLEKTKKRTTTGSNNPTPGFISKKMKTPNQEDSHTPMFITASFTIVKTRKQAK